MVKKQKEGKEEKKAQATPAEGAKAECNDEFCPFHGSTKLHGRTLKGVVTSAKAHKTVTVEKERPFYIPKYERYEKRYTKVLAHNPPCIDAKQGDEVKIMETRPLSKTKHFIVIEVLNRK
jgi:small subunit ribosomal protein S17